MRFKIFAFIWFAALAVAPITLSADNGCCDKPETTCCDKPAMACCDKPTTSPAAPAVDCCQKAEKHDHNAKMNCCKGEGGCDMPCCKDGGDCDMPCCQGEAVDSNAVDVLLAMDRQAIVPLIDITPARQTAVVFFKRPVWVGQSVLMGRYVIEHDTDRQARGEPCTHIYAIGDQKNPVVTFHCTHLEGDRSDTNTVMVRSQSDGTQKFLQFQFRNETAAHGYPTR